MTFKSCCCFVGGFTERHCCGTNDPACWDGLFDYESCCGKLTFENLLAIENNARWLTYFRDFSLVRMLQTADYHTEWMGLQSGLAAIQLAPEDQRVAVAESVFEKFFKPGNFSADLIISRVEKVDNHFIVRDADEWVESVEPRELTIFPTRIQIHRISSLDQTSLDFLVASSLAEFRRLKEESGLGGSQLNDLFFATQMETNRATDHELEVLKAEIRRIALRILKPEGDGLAIKMWSNVLDPGSARMPYHDHPMAILSGCFYPQEENSPISFADPRGSSHFDGSGFEPKAPFHRLAYFVPKRGEVIFFPPWLLHQVSSPIGMARVSFAFNIYEQDETLFAWQGRT